jgi:hypothetical protein
VIGYNTSASLQKRFRSTSAQTNSIVLRYIQTSGDASGLGSVSNTRQAGFSLRRDTRSMTAFVDISAFETTGTLGNSLNARGIQGTATIGVPLTQTLSIQGGAQYQQYDHTSPYAFSEKRVFVSLRYTNPTLLSFSK